MDYQDGSQSLMDFDLTLDPLQTNRQTSRPSHLTAQDWTYTASAQVVLKLK